MLGGCGAMGRVIVKCLRRLNPRLRVTVADRQPPTSLPPKVRFAKVDLRKHAALVRVLRGHVAVINSTSHHFNLPVMRAALDARIHYLDLGGLFHYTRRQLKLDRAFRQKGLCAVLGMGCAPGIANLLARWAAEAMECVKQIHIKVGGRTWGPVSDAMPYAVGTIREELMLKPAIYHNGQWRFEKPRSGVEHFPFPSPVGRQKIFRTIHSEVATLPRSFKGVRESSFRIGFPDNIIRAALGKKPKFPISNFKSQISNPRDCEITLALVRGCSGAKNISRIAYCTAFSSGEHSAGDWDTAWPPAIVTDMLARGEINRAGVFAPENVVPLEKFLPRLRRVGFHISQKRM